MSTWVPVLVRIEDYTEITTLVAKREATRDDSGPQVPLPEVRDLTSLTSPRLSHEDQELALRASWSLEDLGRLARGDTATTRRWTRAMDVCAESPQTWLTTSQIAERSGMTTNEWRDAPRKISRHLRAHYPDVPKDQYGDAYWPLCPRSNLPGSSGEVSWAITAEMADLWHQVRAE